MQSDAELLNDFIRTIQESDDEEVLQLASLIRSNVSVEEAKRCIQMKINQTRMLQSQNSAELGQWHDQMHQVQCDQSETVPSEAQNP